MYGDVHNRRNASSSRVVEGTALGNPATGAFMRDWCQLRRTDVRKMSSPNALCPPLIGGFFLLPGHEVTRKVPGSMSSTINRRKLIAFSAAAGSTLLPGSRAFAQDSTPAASPAAEPVALDEATTI